MQSKPNKETKETRLENGIEVDKLMPPIEGAHSRGTVGKEQATHNSLTEDDEGSGLDSNEPESDESEIQQEDRPFFQSDSSNSVENFGTEQSADTTAEGTPIAVSDSDHDSGAGANYGDSLAAESQGTVTNVDFTSRRKVPDKAQQSARCVTIANIETLEDSRLFINRELSLLAFQWRVLEEAQDESIPLLERFKFLSIVGSNMDEFFMVRVAGLKRQLEAGSLTAGLDGLTPLEQLEAIGAEVNRLLAHAQGCLRESLMPKLTNEGVEIMSYDELTEDQRRDIEQVFLQKIFPVLTPMAFDPGHPFPHISNLSLNLAVSIRKSSGEARFARLKIPDTLPQLIPVVRPGNKVRRSAGAFLWLDDVVRANLKHLFPGMTILEAHPFHITRDAEVEIQEWEAGDLLETTEEGIRQRRFGDVVRLQVDRAMPAHILEILMANLQIEPYDVYLVEGHMPLSS